MDEKGQQVASPVPQQPVENEPSTPSSKVIYIGIAIFFIAIVGMGAFILMHHTPSVAIPALQKSNYQAQNQTPTLAPVTAANADQSLNTTDANMQQSLNQVTTDLNDLNSVDTTQDNPNNL